VKALFGPRPHIQPNLRFSPRGPSLCPHDRARGGADRRARLDSRASHAMYHAPAPICGTHGVSLSHPRSHPLTGSRARRVSSPLQQTSRRPRAPWRSSRAGGCNHRRGIHSTPAGRAVILPRPKMEDISPLPDLLAPNGEDPCDSTNRGINATVREGDIDTSSSSIHCRFSCVEASRGTAWNR
jgi:hypothetical protein